VDALVINYTPTERSVRAACTAGNHFLKLALWVSLGFGGVMAVTEAPSVNWYSLESILFWAITHVVTGLFFGFATATASRYLLIPLNARNLFRKTPMLFGPSSLRADGEGVTVATPNTSASFRWNEMRGYKEVTGAVVFAAGNCYFAIPTADLAESDLQALRKTFSEHLPPLGHHFLKRG
jgi:hypothetical protein